MNTASIAFKPRRLRNAARRMLFRALGKAAVPTATPSHTWSVGIYTGPSPMQLRPAPGIRNPVMSREKVTDIQCGFCADPFLLRAQGRWYMFLEVFNSKLARGEFAVATSNDGLHWDYQQRVLVEPFHLTYPFVLAWQNDFFMIPETRGAGEVRLYKARKFPFEWTMEAVLMDRPNCVDNSVFRYRDHWWMLSENSEMKHDTLRLFHANSLTGPWQEHPCSPIISGNPHIARPSGRVIVHGDEVIRFTQDCSPIYGLCVRAFRITELTPTSYREIPIGSDPLFKGTGRGWNRCGMHHVDAHRLDDGSWLACVDGWYDENDTEWES